MNSANILVIEDDSIVARTIKNSLNCEEYKISFAASGVEGLKAARRKPPDLVILDVVMPGMDGYTVCKEMRSDPLLVEIPILFVTAKIKDEDRIAGFRAGADDYLCKPFNVEELILRVEAILRRTQSKKGVKIGNELPEEEEDLSPRVRAILDQVSSGARTVETNACLVVGEYVLDTRSYELHTPHRGTIHVTPVQYELLYHLMSHPGQVFSPQRLLDEVWNYPTDSGSTDLVRVHIKNLRKQIEVDVRHPKFLRTVVGYGYTVSGDNAPAPASASAASAANEP